MVPNYYSLPVEIGGLRCCYFGLKCSPLSPTRSKIFVDGDGFRTLTTQTSLCLWFVEWRPLVASGARMVLVTQLSVSGDCHLQTPRTRPGRCWAGTWGAKLCRKWVVPWLAMVVRAENGRNICHKRRKYIFFYPAQLVAGVETAGVVITS